MLMNKHIIDILLVKGEHMNKTFAVLAVLGFGYLVYVSKGGLDGIKRLNGSETTIPDSSQPNMKTKVPAGANSDHIWLVKG